MLKKIRPSIWPSAAASTMFGGTMLRNNRASWLPPVPAVAPTLSATARVLSSSASSSRAGSPLTMPGCTMFTSTRPIRIASSVVTP